MSAAHRRAVAGAHAHAEGDWWEKALDDAHAAYRHAGIAIVEKKPTPTVPAPGFRQRQGPRLQIFAARSSYDYHGVLGHDIEPGQAIAMEAKANAAPKPSMRVSLVTAKEAGKNGTVGGLQWHQLCALKDAIDFNALGVVVWANGHRHDDGARLVLMPDKVYELHQRAERLRGVQKSMSISRDEFAPFSTGRVGGVMVDDWLAPVIEWMNTKKGASHG